MSNSPLATITVLANASNYTKGRQAKIRCVTVHHMAGINTVESCGAIFQRPGRNGSSHYGIGNDGKIGLYVNEEDTAWTNSNWPSNCESVTIEVSNSAMGGNWPVSDAAFNSLVKLVADIAKRNNLGKLVKGDNLTWHSMFTNTTCPGPYLLGKLDEIVNQANKLNGYTDPEPKPTPKPTPAPAPSTGFAVGDKVTLSKYVDYNGTALLKTRDYYYINQISGNRAVLTADSVNGAIYAAVNTNNLVKIGSTGTTPATPVSPSTIVVGDRVTLKDWVDYNGTRLLKTRDFYYVSEINGDRCVLRADNMNGPVYAAVKKSNLKEV